MTYTIRIADIHKDKQALLSLWKNNLESSFEERYEWIYQKNPTGPPRCFLLCNEGNDAIVGAITLFPRNFSIQGRLVSAFVCGDLVVERGHRTLGPAIKLIKEGPNGK